MLRSLETPPNELQSFKIMISSGSMLAKESPEVSVHDESKLRIFVHGFTEGSLQEHEYEEVDSDVEYLCLLRVVDESPQDFWCHIQGSTGHSCKRNTN